MRTGSASSALLLATGTRLLGDVGLTKAQLATEESPKLEKWEKKEAELIRLLFVLGCHLGEINRQDSWQRFGT